MPPLDKLSSTVADDERDDAKVIYATWAAVLPTN